MNQSVSATTVADFLRRPRPLVLRCGVQHYAWGDPDYIPDLIGVPNPEQKPYAELWIGAHAELPAVARVGASEVPLPLLLRGAAEVVLGRRDAERFGGRLPFLLKILAAAQPLSIQAHPDKRQAQAGFERENRLGIRSDAPNRNYHDDNHKPELIVALTEFYALCGFRPLDELGAVLASVPELCDLAADDRPTRELLRDLYTRVMRMDQTEVDAILTPLVRRLQEEAARQAFSKEQTEYWVLRADSVFSNDGHRDRGLFSLFLLNLVHLLPGEAMYLPAGELHAYLQGAGVEIMANSNNVLRGGLTAKHTDVDELLRILTFDAGKVKVMGKGLGPAEERVVYETPSQEFILSRLRITAARPYASAADHSPALGVVIQGEVAVSATGLEGGLEGLELGRGGVFLVPHGLDYRISCSISRSGEAVVFMAGIPRG
ncbi:mannose-6-phosphate isomerase, class I [Candidatus Thiosymbion oneisti]|uniref:mannose-6-phosphate isomerase, class I n=1 Tax=Candidatus Thiosymbion oneisti TaxID=589554 RepID=UPI000A3D9CF3|nr:mannose-6-phosphate isomerase, class I [Candidatus Thiosymbion oneisti]